MGFTRRRFLVLAGLVVAHSAAVTIRQIDRRLTAADVRDLGVERLGGQRASLGQIAAGRPLLLVFWTSWCAYCVEQMKGGAGLVESLLTGPAPVAVAFVNVREHPRVVAGCAAVSAVSDHVVLDLSGSVAHSLGVSAFPTYVLVDRNGRPIWSRRGSGGPLADEVASRLSGETS